MVYNDFEGLWGYVALCLYKDSLVRRYLGFESKWGFPGDLEGTTASALIYGSCRAQEPAVANSRLKGLFLASQSSVGGDLETVV